MLSIIIFLPLFGGFLALASARRAHLCRLIALIVALTDLALVISLIFLDLRGQSGPTGTWLLVEDFPWLESLGIRYSLGVDGVSLMLILLTTFLTAVCVLASWRHIDTRVGAFHFFLLFMSTGILGVFLAIDLFLFYLFWEVQLVPMFFLVGIWGHAQRIHATIKFVLFTIAGSLLMLISLIALYLIHGVHTGVYTFSLLQLMRTPLTGTAEILLYAAFLLAFAVKIPVLPVHTWLPDTHTEAPTAGSVILAGLLLKTGTYALLRIAFPLFPMAARLSAPLLLLLGVAGIFYAAWIALAQTDIKRLVAYSSIAHMGFVVIGLAIWNSLALTGALLQMINHGLSTSALFILVGMFGERVGSRNVGDLGGFWKRMPVLSAFLLFFALSSLGLPGLNNFVGELLILVGTFTVRPVIAILGFSGLVLTLIFILRLVQDAVFGQERKEHTLWDATPREVLILGVIAAVVLFIGLHPGPILELFRDPVQNILKHTTQVGF
jgi:NADH-quinone oxidoreductase subunit M